MTEPIVLANGVWCPQCEEYVEFLKVSRAAKRAGVAEKTIYRYIEDGSVHSMRVANKTYRVCARSLFVFEQEARARRESDPKRTSRATNRTSPAKKTKARGAGKP